MSKENKRYFWLKLEDNFFEDDTITWLEEQPSGKEYIIFYLKLCLSSLKDNGNLIRYVGNTLLPYDVKALARLTNTNEDTVRVAMSLFEKIGLVQIKDTGEIYMSQINEMIGSETEVAKRVRKHRAKKALDTKEKMLLQSNTDETKCNSQETKCNTEKEKEKELDIEKEKDIELDFSFIHSSENNPLALQCNTNATPTQQIETKRNTEKEKEKEKDTELDSSFIHSNESNAVYLFPIEDGSTYPITTNNIELLEEKYPTLELHHEFMLMGNWLKQDEKRLKPADYMPKFIDNWLSQSLENKNKGRRY